MLENGWAVGDWAVYRKTKESVAPGPRARNVSPAPRGDTYRYTVDKYWIVVEVMPEEGALILQTRRGKRHKIQLDDPLLKRPSWWVRLLLRNRFHEIETAIANGE